MVKDLPQLPPPTLGGGFATEPAMCRAHSRTVRLDTTSLLSQVWAHQCGRRRGEEKALRNEVDEHDAEQGANAGHKGG